MNRATYWSILLPVTLLIVGAAVFLPKPPGIIEIVIVYLGVPRLHDVGRSGWWMAVPIAVELIAVALGAVLGGLNGILIAGGVAVMVIAAIMTVIGIIPGQVGANIYGDPPPTGLSLSGRSQAT
jgi:uncharacterized membrane protein YhaH (DUF805 family)